MAHTNLKMQKKKEWNPFKTRTIKRAAVGRVKCFIKSVGPNPHDSFGRNREEWEKDFDRTRIYYYEVGANDGSYRKIMTREEAETRFAQLVNFEKKQTEIR